MDGPLVYLLQCQLHGRVAKPGRDKRWRHLSVKPPSRWDIPFFKEVRPLEDDEVDRAEVEVQQCMELTATNRSRAWPEHGSANGGVEKRFLSFVYAVLKVHKRYVHDILWTWFDVYRIFYFTEIMNRNISGSKGQNTKKSTVHQYYKCTVDFFVCS